VIELYVGPTPNGRKVAIMLEETGLDYRTHMIDILAGDQLKPQFLAINPNNKQPAMVDTGGPGGKRVTVWESCAILVYLARKAGQFLPSDPVAEAEVMQWLLFQAANQGPMAGQYAHFAFYAKESIPYAIERYENEVNRQFGLMDRHLQDRQYFAGNYSIADMALLPYAESMIKRSRRERPHLQAWVERLMQRPAVRKGMVIMDDEIREETIAGGLQGFDDEHRSILFGSKQYAER
jgi:GST-like protein